MRRSSQIKLNSITLKQSLNVIYLVLHSVKNIFEMNVDKHSFGGIERNRIFRLNH